ncbi:MAG: zinc-dependent metalloprotease [Acidobacteria bacterium]|nr:zinc-dependent metalloprotease [Acidobacteriota bacterium]
MNWDATSQLALSLASGGESEPNVDPAARISMEQLARVAELHMAEATGLPGEFRVTPVNRTEWARRSLDDYRPLFEALSSALAKPTEIPDQDEDPVMGPLMAALSPMMLSFTAGGMIGHLAQRSLGTYDLPVPRSSPDTMVVMANVDAFGDEWSLPRDDLRMWVALHEAAHKFVLSVPHVAARIDDLLIAFASNFTPNPLAIEEHLGGLDLDANPSQLANISEVFSNPEVLLGAATNDAQREIQASLSAVIAAVVGYVDHLMDRVGESLISSYGQVTEALRRRRVEADASDRFVERLLGLELSQDSYDRAGRFIAGVHERAGGDGLTQLWSAPNHLPTPPEIDAPGLWLARIELDN